MRLKTTWLLYELRNIYQRIIKIIKGNNLLMTELPDNSMHLIITSLPYRQLKDCVSENQTGFHDTCN